MLSDQTRNKLAAKAVVNRLLQMRQLWEDAAREYFDPFNFVTKVQNCIVTSRTVTFILQSNKKNIPNFDEWYEIYRSRWSKDSVMNWVRDARNFIEKRGDLETLSQMRAIIIAGYFDGPTTNWFPDGLFKSPVQIWLDVPNEYITPHIVENGTLIIERRWIDKDLPDIELLEALSYVYSELAIMVVDLLKVLNVTLPASLLNTKPDALGKLAMNRAIYLSMRDGSLRGFRYTKKIVESDQGKSQKFFDKRYGSLANLRHLARATTIAELAEGVFESAKIVMYRDKGHGTFVFFLKRLIIINMLQANFTDRASKFVQIRDFAKLARIEGSDGVMIISEAWIADAANIPASGFAADAQVRREALSMQVVISSGEAFSLIAFVERKSVSSRKIKSIGNTVIEKGQNYLSYPFLQE